MTKTEYLFRELRSSLWVKPAIMGLAAAGWVTIAYLFAEYLPDKLKIGIEREILINLLGIMASTMLTVATFSVAAMVSAFGSVATTATPRATRIVMADRTTQNSLTSFLSAFIYAIVALVAISLGNYYGPGGRLLLFAGYCIMVGWVLISFVRWVDRVSKLGRMGDTLERVEEACREPFSSPDAMGTLGAKKAGDHEISGAMVKSDVIGYVQNIDVEALDEIAGELGTTIRVLERPGAFVDPHNSLVVVADRDSLEDEIAERIRNCFVLGDTRRVDLDPRLRVLPHERTDPQEDPLHRRDLLLARPVGLGFFEHGLVDVLQPRHLQRLPAHPQVPWPAPGQGPARSLRRWPRRGPQTRRGLHHRVHEPAAWHADLLSLVVVADV